MAAGNSPGIFGFDPRSVPGCQLWLDAFGSTNFTFSSGSNISVWRDNSIYGRNLGVGSGTTTFDSTSNAVVLNSSYMFVDSAVDLTNYTMFIVVKSTSATNNQSVFTAKPAAGTSSYNSSNGLGFYMDYQTTMRLLGVYTPTTAFISNVGGSFGSPTIFSLSASGTTGSSWVNGTTSNTYTAASTRAGTARGFAIGAEWQDPSSYTNIISTANIYEILVFNTTLATAQRQQVEGYLAWKWGLKSNIPTTHPFALIKPHARTFQPVDVPNLKLWWDSAAPSSFTYTSGSNISTWTDRVSSIPLSYKAVPPILSAAGGVYLSNASTNISATQQSLFYSNVAGTGITLTQSFTVIVAHYPLSNDGYRTPFTMSAPVTFNVNPSLSATIGCGAASGNMVGAFNGSTAWISLQQATAVTSLIPRVDSILSDASNFTYTNGVENSYGLNNIGRGTVASGTGLISGMAIGGHNTQFAGNQMYSGYVYEILLYDAALSFSDIRRVEGYLAKKWNFQSNLVNTHPNFKIPPSSPLPFAPTSISGCALWLDAADSSSITLSGTNVTQWGDKSGNGYNFTVQSGYSSPTLSTNAMNSLNSISFTGPGINGSSSSQFLTNASFPLNSSTNGYSMFVVSKQNASHPSYTGYNYIVSCRITAGTGIFYGTIATTYYLLTANGTAGPVSGFNDLTANSPNVLMTSANQTSIVVSGSSLAPYYNGAAMTTKTGTCIGLTGLSIGDAFAVGNTFSGQNWNGLISEVLIYNSALTTAQRQQIEGYLAWKWGIQTSLTFTHPYYQFPSAFVPINNIVTANLIVNLDPTSYITSSTSWIGTVGNTWTFSTAPTLISTTASRALSFNGSQYVMDQTGFTTGPASTSSYTVEIWFYAAAAVASNLLSEMGQAGSPATGWNVTIMYLSGNTIYAAFWQGSVYSLSLGAYTANTWNQACYTYSGTTVTGYVNGVYVSTGTATKQYPGRGYYCIAGGGNPYSGTTACSIGGCRFYSSNLSAAEVKQNYNAYAPRFGRGTI